MNIDAITDGIVIDHITAGKGIKLYGLLKLDGVDAPVAIIKNAASKKMGKKDIIKIGANIDIDFDIIGLADRNATVNIIKGGKLSEKMKIALPDKITNVIRCKNPRCITSCEQELEHVFYLADEKSEEYRCIYCESKGLVNDLLERNPADTVH